VTGEHVKEEEMTYDFFDKKAIRGLEIYGYYLHWQAIQDQSESSVDMLTQ